jgi:soluble lytic murein transglycosylase
MTEAERGKVLYEIALWTVASYLPDSARRLAAVPESAYDERLHEWRVREAMARATGVRPWRRCARCRRRSGRLALALFRSAAGRETGDKAQAQRLLGEAAKSPTFHGFLAADRLRQPYALCPWTPKDSPALRPRSRAIRPSSGHGAVGARASRLGHQRMERRARAFRRHPPADRSAGGAGPRLVRPGGVLARRQARRDPPVCAALPAAPRRGHPPRSGPARHRPGLGRGRDPRRKHLQSQGPVRRQRHGPDAGAARHRRRHRAVAGMSWAGAASLYDPDTNIAIGTAY